MVQSSDNTDQRLIKWACITVHPSLPSQSEQVAGARAWGAYKDWLGTKGTFTTFTDDVSEVGRTTNWPSKLPERKELLNALFVTIAARNEVFFKTPLCLGFSKKHAQDTITDIFDCDSMVFIQSEQALYRRGDDFTELLEQVGREAKAATQQRYRTRLSSIEDQSNAED